MSHEWNSRRRFLSALYLEDVDTVPVMPYGVYPHQPGSFTEDPSYQPLITLVEDRCDALHPYSPRIGRNIFLSSSDRASIGSDSWKEGDRIFYSQEIDTPRGLLRCIDSRHEGGPFRCIKPYIESDEDLEKFLSVPYEKLTIDASNLAEEDAGIDGKGLLRLDIPEPLGYVAPLFRFEDFVSKSYNRKEVIRELLDIFFERCMDYAIGITKVGVEATYWLTGPEYAAPPLFPPKFFREYVRRYDSEIIKIVHEGGGIAVIHCHGSINRILEEFTAMRVDALHPVEAPPLGDTPLSEAKKRIGDRVCFIGNIQIGDIYVSPCQEIDEKVRDAINACPDGGLILSTTASPHWSPIPTETLKNYFQFVDSGRKYGANQRRYE